MSMWIRDFETLLDHKVEKIAFEPEHGSFGRILLALADGQQWEFQLRSNALRRGIDGLVIDGFEPVKTVQGCKASVFHMLYRLDELAPLEPPLRTAGILNRNCLPAKCEARFDSMTLAPTGAAADKNALPFKVLAYHMDGVTVEWKGKPKRITSKVFGAALAEICEKKAPRVKVPRGLTRDNLKNNPFLNEFFKAVSDRGASYLAWK